MTFLTRAAGAAAVLAFSTGLALLLQSNALRVALQPYTLEGPHGRLLDGDPGRVDGRRTEHRRGWHAAPRGLR